MERSFATFGAVSAGIAVAAGAFGAHALRARLDPPLLDVFETAARYQMYHALALILIAFASPHLPVRLVRASGWSFIAGTVLFAGSLYLLALTGTRWLGAVTPLGGLCFLAGWFLLAAAAHKGASAVPGALPPRG